MKLLCQSRSVTPGSLWHTYTCTYICIYMLYAVIHNRGGGGVGSNSEVTCDLKISGAEQQQYSNERETAVLLFFFLSFFVIFIELSEVWTSHFKDSRIAFYSFKDMLFILHIVLSDQTFRTGFIQIYWPIMASWIIGRPSYRILNSCISIPFRNKVELGIFFLALVLK